MTTRKLLTAPLALVAGLSLALSACGDDEGTSTTSAEGEPPSKAEFIAAADEICTETSATVAAEAEERFPDGAVPADGNDAIEDFFAEVTIPALKAQYEEIGSLEPPAGSEEEVEEIVAEGNAAVAKAEADPESLVVLSGFKTPFDKVGQLERKFGFQVCGAADPELDEG
jgi:hypothetical protein